MSKCILVVEDEKDNRQILRDLLGNAGYELTEAENGEEAIAAAAERRPSLILMDIQLPIVDGYEATRRIRSNPDLRSVPIIAVTSHALAGDEDKALAAGCDGYVSKPWPTRFIGKGPHLFGVVLTPRSGQRRGLACFITQILIDTIRSYQYTVRRMWKT